MAVDKDFQWQDSSKPRARLDSNKTLEDPRRGGSVHPASGPNGCRSLPLGSASLRSSARGACGSLFCSQSFMQPTRSGPFTLRSAHVCLFRRETAPTHWTTPPPPLHPLRPTIHGVHLGASNASDWHGMHPPTSPRDTMAAPLLHCSGPAPALCHRL